MNGREWQIPSFVNAQKGRGVERGSKQQWPHINEETALTKTVYKVLEQRKIRTFTYKIKYKCENEVKKAVLKLGEEQERSYM
jgi:hypothetical protein